MKKSCIFAPTKSLCMLNRRQLRFKAFQELYAYFVSAENDVVEAEKKLDKSINAAKELMVWQLSLLIELHYYFLRRTEDAKLKLLPTDQDLNPNMRFVNNRFLVQLAENKDVRQLISAYKVSWLEHAELIRRLYNSIKDSKDYENYLKSNDSFEEDKKFVVKICQNFIFDDDALNDLYETKNMYWHTDFYLTQYNLLSAFDKYFSENVAPVEKIQLDDETILPEFVDTDDNKKTVVDHRASLQKDREQFDEDKKFAKSLFRSTIQESDRTFELIKNKTINWEVDRVSVVDVIILKMALTELLRFPTIPVRVTLNEYIELSKTFSSPKSKVFINGILDKLIGELTKSGDIVKTGRGLM